MGFPVSPVVSLRHVSFTGIDISVLARKGGPRPTVVATNCEDNAPLDPFLAWVLQRGGVSPEPFRGAALNRRLPACLRLLRVPSARSAQEMLQRRPDLLPATLTTVLIGVTQFFREPAVFESLRDLVLPRLRSHNGPLRIASFGVSRGHELYSAAILLAEAGLLERSVLTGVDCRSDAIVAAAAGRFDATDLAGLSQERLERFFERRQEYYWANANIKARMHWQVADLFAFKAAHPFQLIFFRNVAIYLDSASVAQAWEVVFEHAAPGSYIVTGKAERPPAKLQLRRIAPSVYVRGDS